MPRPAKSAKATKSTKAAKTTAKARAHPAPGKGQPKGAGLALTPGGWRPRAQVHRLPPGHHLSGKGGRLRIIHTASGKVKADLGATVTKTVDHAPRGRATTKKNARGKVPYPDNGWIANSGWTRTGTKSISSFSTKWVVPPPPATNSGQTVFLFNGLEQSGSGASPNGPYILQPVLQWGPSEAGGGSYWSITNWYVNGPGGSAVFGNLVQVSPGVSLQGLMTLTGQSAGAFNYSSVFTGYASANLTVTDIAELTWACETLECYNITQASDYPNTVTTAMTSIEIKQGNTEAAINWSAGNNITENGQSCVIGSNASPGGVVYLNYKTAWGPSTQYDSGGPNAVALDRNNVVEVHVGSGKLYYRVGTVNFGNQTIAWGGSTKYDSGGPNAVAIDDNGHAVEVHVGSGNLYYHVGNVNYSNQTIAWGASTKYDSGGPNAIAMDNNGNVVEVHVGSGNLYYHVGKVNFANQTIAWGPSTKYDTGGPNAIAMDDNGNVVEVHVGSGKLYYHVGTVDFANQTIAWGPSVQYDSGGPNAVTLDDDGNAMEVHVGSGTLYYHVGTVDFANKTIAWGGSLRYDTGGPNAVALNYHRQAVEVHVGSNKLYYRVGLLTALQE